jgi:hypothetical protein
MMYISTLFSFMLACLPLATAFIIGRLHSNRLGLAHIYLILVALAYGAYTFIDLLANSNEGVDEFAMAVLIISISVSMIATAVVVANLPRRISYSFSVRYLIEEAERAPFPILAFFWLVVMAFTAFSYYQYGIITYAEKGRLAAAGIELQGWWGSVKSLVTALAFSIFMWLMCVISKKGGAGSRYRLLMLGAIVLLLSLNGRRVFLNMLIVGGIIFCVARGRSVFGAGNLVRAPIALGIFIGFSNLFQSIRRVYLSFGGLDDSASADFSLFDAIFDFQGTGGNLHDRMAVWRYHYAIVVAQLKDLTHVMGGELTWAGLLGSIPSFVYPDKGIAYKDDFATCLFYVEACADVGRLDIDLPTTLYSSLQADFGFLFIIVVPIFILAILLLLYYYASRPRRTAMGPVLYVLVFGLAAEFLMNIESSMGNFFILLRNVAILTVSIGALEFVAQLVQTRKALGS